MTEPQALDKKDANQPFERNILGACILRAEAWDTVQDRLSAHDFTHPAHQDLFHQLSTAAEENWLGDSTLLIHRLEEHGTVGAAEMVFDAIESAAPEATLTHYINDLIHRTAAREITAASNQFTNTVRNSDEETSIETLIADYSQTLADITERTTESPWEDLPTLVDQIASGQAQIDVSVPSGFADMDRLLNGGFRPKQMVTIAGRPAMGKSTFAVDIIREAVFRRFIPCMFISLEMSSVELTSRILSAERGVELGNITSNSLSDEERARLINAKDDMEDAPLLMVEPTASYWENIRSLIIEAHRKSGIKAVVIDYLQLMELSEKPRGMSRQEEITAISRRVKQLARRLDITIFAVAQLNRGSESRSGNIPQMSDLRDSGAIEQDSDVIILLHRAEYYDNHSERAGEADAIVAKHRNGKTGTVTLAFMGHYSRFVNLAFETGNEPEWE